MIFFIRSAKLIWILTQEKNMIVEDRLQSALFAALCTGFLKLFYSVLAWTKINKNFYN